MIIESIHLQNFLSHEDTAVDFAGKPLWLVCGDNGTGKSALFDAVEYALYGSHRGGETGAKLLVKQGTKRAKVEAVFQLEEHRYRVTQEIDSKTGNLGGHLEEWHEETQAWHGRNVGPGVPAVWKWLEPRLPKKELFNSAVFLRQGETAIFLRGSTKDRLKRFADLIDLSRFTMLSQRAEARTDAAKSKAQEVRGSLNELGDISDEAARKLESVLAVSDCTLAAAVEKVVAAQTIARGAEEWARLCKVRTGLLEHHARSGELLAEESAIRHAARHTAEWDAVAVKIDRYWQARTRGAQARVRADQHRGALRQIEEMRTSKQGALEQAQTEHRMLVDVKLPAANQRLEQSDGLVRALALELQISEARSEFEF